MSVNETHAAMLLSYAKNDDITPQDFARAIKGLDSLPSPTIELIGKPVKDDTADNAVQKFANMLAAKLGLDKKGRDSEDPKHGDDDDDETKDLKDRLKKAEDSLAEMKKAADKKGKDSESDDLEKLLDDEKSGDDSDDEDDDEKTKKAHDAALRSVVIALKPVLAKMPEKLRKEAKDSLRPLLHGVPAGDENTYAEIQKAMQASSKKAMDKASAQAGSEPLDLDKIAAEIATEWAPK